MASLADWIRQRLRRRRNRLARRVAHHLAPPVPPRTSCYVGDHVVLTQTVHGRPMYVDSRDLSLGPSLIVHGTWEPWITQQAERLIQPGMTVIDVGANAGWYALRFADLVGPRGRVVAFEPNPRVFDILQRNVTANGLLEPNGCVTVRRQAVADVCGERTLWTWDRHTGSSSLSRPGAAKPGHYGDTVEEVAVETITIDAAVEELGLDRVDLVKTDTEGCEHLVVRSMDATFGASPRLQLLLEFWPNGDGARGLLADLTGRGYEFLQMERTGELRPRTSEDLLQGEPCDLLARPAGEAPDPEGAV